MATSKSSLWSSLRYAIAVIHGLFKNASIDTNNFMTNYRALQAANEGNNVNSVEAILTNIRTSLNTIVNQVGILTPILLELARVGYNGLATNVTVAIQEIRDGMDANSETVKERGMVYGTITNGASNLGSGMLFRCTYDKNGFLIEGCQYQSGKLICTVNLDSYTGRQPTGKEKALLKGDGVVPVDSLERGTCPGGTLTLTAMRNEDCLLTNAQLAYVDSGTTIAITDWTLQVDTKTTAVTMIDDDLREGSNTVVFHCNNYIKQSLEGIVITDSNYPYFLIVQIEKTEAGSNGNLVLTLGSKTAQVDISTLTLNEKSYLTIGVDDEDGYYENWKSDSPELKISLESSTTGSIEIQNIILAQPTKFDSLYYMLISADTPFVANDTFTMTDSSSNTGNIQSTLARLYGEHLPHTAGTPTYTDIVV